jgi:glycosyltransferase involved in cell wall biosynthesis
MMHLFINSLAASAGGGLTYIRNVLPLLDGRPDLRVTVALKSDLRSEFHYSENVEFLDVTVPSARRFWFEQIELPRLIRKSGADVLLSTGNISLRRSPVPQILLSRNSIYLSSDFYRDLRARGEYRVWLDTRLRAMIARKSIAWADLTVAPSEAFASELAHWTGGKIHAVHHGFDSDSFTRNSDPLEVAVQQKLNAAEESLKILFVSHYNYYRNFETLIQSLPLLRERLSSRSIKLLLTCHLVPGRNPGDYNPESARNLVKKLGVSDMVVELGAIPYRQLHQVYASADIYVTPAYTETFAHPLVEAMASGVPVVASDLPVHREICENAAIYFPKFSPEVLADGIVQIASSCEAMSGMAAAGHLRARQFSWKTHVDKILDLCAMLVNRRPRGGVPKETSTNLGTSRQNPQTNQKANRPGAAMIGQQLSE